MAMHEHKSIELKSSTFHAASEEETKLWCRELDQGAEAAGGGVSVVIPAAAGAGVVAAAGA